MIPSDSNSERHQIEQAIAPEPPLQQSNQPLVIGTYRELAVPEIERLRRRGVDELIDPAESDAA